MENNKHDFNNVFFQQASRLAKIGSWELDVVNDKIYWSTIVHELHETNPETFIPNLGTALGFYRNDYRSIVNEIILKSIETGAAFDFEAVIVTKKKKERWIRAIGNVEMIHGKCQRIIGSFQDIHSSKLLALQMREILESISDAFYAVEKIGNLLILIKKPRTCC